MFFLLVTALKADVVVAPNAFEDRPGTGSQGPFDISEGRYLNVYNASEFLPFMPNGGRITAIAFRLDESAPEGMVVHLPDIEIRLSTSSSMAPVIPFPFAANIGSDE